MSLVFGSVHVGAQDPLLLCGRLVHSAQNDLVWFHFEAGAQLFRFNAFVVLLAVDVMAERDEVVPILVGDNAL